MSDAGREEERAEEIRRLDSMRANDPRPRKARYYKLGEKDHATIIDGLKHFASVYHISLKIGCGYSTLKKYIKEHPDLLKVQDEARQGVSEFIEAQIVRAAANGNFKAMAFYAERKMGWTQNPLIDNGLVVPNITLGLIPEADIPTDGTAEPIKLGVVQKLPEKEDAADTRETEEEIDEAARESEVVDFDPEWED